MVPRVNPTEAVLELEESDAVALLNRCLRLVGGEPVGVGEGLEQGRRRLAVLMPGALEDPTCDCGAAIATAIVSDGVEDCPFCLRPFATGDEEEDDAAVAVDGPEEEFDVDPAGEPDGPVGAVDQRVEVAAPAAAAAPEEQGDEHEAPAGAQEEPMATQATTVGGKAGKGNGQGAHMARTLAKPPEVVTPPTLAERSAIRTPSRGDLEDRTRRILDLKQQTGESTYAMGVELKEVRDQGMFSAAGYKSWETWVETDCRITSAWAEKVVRAVEAYDAGQFKAMGETNAVRLLALPDGQRKKWVERLCTAPMTKRELEKAIAAEPRNMNKGSGTGKGSGAVAKTLGGGRPRKNVMLEELVDRPYKIKLKNGVGQFDRLPADYVIIVKVDKDSCVVRFGKRPAK